MADQDPPTGWEESRRRKLVIGLDATPEQRLDWLEEMMTLAHATGALPRRRGYVLPLEGTIEHDGHHGGVALAEASFVSTDDGALSFLATWNEGEMRWSMRLHASGNEQFVGNMSAPHQPGDEHISVKLNRSPTAPRAWELRGTYLEDGGKPGPLTLRLSEKPYR